MLIGHDWKECRDPKRNAFQHLGVINAKNPWVHIKNAECANDNFGAVGPFEYEKEMTATNMVGSVQVAIDEAYHNKSSDSEDDLVDPRLTSNEIQQKILLATTPKSKAKAIEHLNLELTLVNQDIQKLSDQVGLHKRSMS